MQIKIEKTPIKDLIIIIPEVFEDKRGFFMETFRTDQFKELGLPVDFLQDNHSRSAKGVLRGLHFQWAPPMGKLMRVTHGSAYLIAVDIRKGSPTLGKWYGIEVSAQNKKQVYAPAGFARGFCVLSDFAEIQYKCTGIYNNKLSLRKMDLFIYILHSLSLLTFIQYVFTNDKLISMKL